MKNSFKQNHSLELSTYLPTPEEIPGPPIACIYVKTYSSEPDKRLSITPRCCSFAELEAEIRRLEAELKSIRGRGKTMFHVDKK